MGLILGFPLAVLTLNGFEIYRCEIFRMPFVMYPSTYVITAVVILLTLAVSILPAIKYIAKMEIEKITKEVE